MTDLREASFVGAKLTGADLAFANLRGADFSNADVRGAVLVGADLRGARFEGAIFQDTDLAAALFDPDLLKRAPAGALCATAVESGSGNYARVIADSRGRGDIPDT